MTSEQQWLEAEERGHEESKNGLYAISANYDTLQKVMHVTLRTGVTLSFPKERCQVMAAASEEDLRVVAVEGAGRYILFTKLDDGFTVEGMLAGNLGNRQWEEAWAAKHRDPVAA